jgi:glycosyltransferase involved in cell wall biosynthesis
MKIAIYLQLQDELEKGNLRRCLNNCKQYADYIFIYDDCSKDGSQDVYKEYVDPSHIILGTEPSFHREMFIKQQLFELAIKTNADWLGWVDGDAILDRQFTLNLKAILEQKSKEGIETIQTHYTNLWRSDSFCRMDNLFNDLYIYPFWKNNGRLHYKPYDGLHQPQYPLGTGKATVIPYRFIHYGFSTEYQIVRKYLMYKGLGQAGYYLDRLIDESSLVLKRLDISMYPVENIPVNHLKVPLPQKLTYNEYRKFPNWEEFKKSSVYKELVKCV